MWLNIGDEGSKPKDSAPLQTAALGGANPSDPTIRASNPIFGDFCWYRRFIYLNPVGTPMSITNPEFISFEITIDAEWEMGDDIEELHDRDEIKEIIRDVLETDWVLDEEETETEITVEITELRTENDGDE